MMLSNSHTKLQVHNYRQHGLPRPNHHSNNNTSNNQLPATACQIKRKRRRTNDLEKREIVECWQMRTTSRMGRRQVPSDGCHCQDEKLRKEKFITSRSHKLKMVPLFISFMTSVYLVSQNNQASAFLQQQSMSPNLQVFSGNDSKQAEANHFKVLKQHGEFVLVGARNFLYNLSATTMREQRRIEWPSTSEDIGMCRVKGKTSEQCQNYIKVVEMDSPETITVCGTNAYKPKCRSYFIGPTAYEFVQEYPGEGVCPYQETQNVTSLVVDGQLYSATTAQFNGMDGLIHRSQLRTEQFNPKQLNSPNFVSSFRYGDHVYFLFKEIAIEHINCGKTIYSRIARVCINDSGGPTRSARERWTSFVKARLNCSVPGEFPFAFDEIQSSTHVVSSAYQQAAPLSAAAAAAAGGAAGASSSSSSNKQQTVAGDQDLIYAVFTTPQNSIGGSAICAYRMSDILAAFEGPFKSQVEGGNSNWLPVPESRVPQLPSRPGRCVNDSRRLPDEHVNFIRENPLMDQAIEPIWSQPLITMASINFRFTQIVVDTRVSTAPVFGAQEMRTDVIFVSTDDGRVFKLINTHHLYASSAAHRILAAASSFSGQVGATGLQQQQQQVTGGRMQATAAQLQVGAPPNFQTMTNAREPVVDVSASTVVIEELHLFDSRTPVVAMLLLPPTIHPSSSSSGHGSRLVVASSKQIKSIPVSRCERALNCADCLALYDPYCAWDTLQQACLSIGKSPPSVENSPGAYHDHQASMMANEIYHSHYLGFAASSRTTTGGPSNNNNNNIWHPPNSNSHNSQISNHSLAWWLACPISNSIQHELTSVGPPFKSMFSSHLQVPSRFDYDSGHHLSRAPLLLQTQPVANQQPQRQPVSECLTFCGAGAGVVPVPQTLDTINQNVPAECVDFLGQQQQQQQQQMLFITQQQQQTQRFGGDFSANNIYSPTVIISAISILLLGLLLGFVFGKRSSFGHSLCGGSVGGSAGGVCKNHDSSICSSTFDETNLYMASTGSHQAVLAANFQQLHQPQHAIGGGSHLSNQLFAQQNHQLARQQNQYLTHNAHGQQSALRAAAYPDSTTMTTHHQYSNSNDGQQQHLLLQLSADRQKLLNGMAPIRTGALPPLPQQQQQQQQPLISTTNGPTTHINHSELTPPTSSSGASSTNGSNSAAQTQQQQEQLYLNQQHLLLANHQQGGPTPVSAAKLHQRSFSGGNNNNNNINNSSTNNTAQSQQQQSASNKIYL